MSTLKVNSIQNATGTTAITLDASGNATFAGTVVSSSPMGMRNRIINGDMRIDQRNAGASVSNANGFITDRWSLSKYDPTGGSYSGQQVTDAPTGFTNSLKVTVTSSITQSADQYWQAFQTIEGYNVADLGFGTSSPSQVTVSFWVKSSVTGTYSISLYNHGVGGGARSYITTYTITAANTWEYKTVTIAGDGASGAGYWGTTNGGGIGVYFDLGCGTNQQNTANTWTATNARRVSGTVRLMATGSATWQITGVQLEVGTSATPFERRLYSQELANCQRYYQCIGGAFNGSASYQYYGMGVSYNTTTVYFTVPLQVYMRTAPSFTAINTANFLLYSTGGFTPSSITADISSPNVIGIVAASSGMVAGQAFRLIQNSGNSTQIQFSAEL